MTEDRVLKWLLDIRSAIQEIEDFTPKSGRSIRLLQRNTMFKRAVERNIEIIGEAVNRILVAEPGIGISSACQIVFIIHE